MSKAARRVVCGTLFVVMVALLLTGILILLVHPRVFNINTYMDVNSGDVRAETTFCGLRVSNRIRATPFSREVRRLGVAVPKSRAWQLAREEQGLLMGSHSHCRLDYVKFDLEFLIEMFAHGEVSDGERVVILQRIMESLKDSKLAAREVRAQVEVMESKVYDKN